MFKKGELEKQATVANFATVQMACTLEVFVKKANWVKKANTEEYSVVLWDESCWKSALNIKLRQQFQIQETLLVQTWRAFY